MKRLCPLWPYTISPAHDRLCFAVYFDAGMGRGVRGTTNGARCEA